MEEMPRRKEKRRRPRIDIALPIQIRYNTKEIVTVTRNISVLGTYIEIGEELPAGVDLAIQLKLTEKDLSMDRERQISCSGVVFRCQPVLSEKPGSKYGAGVFFRSFSQAGETILADYIERMILLEQEAGKRYIKKISKKRSKGGEKQ
ncbi:MAG: PilZ domain-containing protein [Candidatus Omnitrophota bacterium]